MVMSRQRQIQIAAVALLLAGGIGGVLIGLSPIYLAPIWAGVATALVLAAVFLAMLPRWQRLDHMQRDSRLLSWYWGGGFGGGLALVLTLTMAGSGSPIFIGAAAVWLLQCAGYLAGRFWWWFAHRAEAA